MKATIAAVLRTAFLLPLLLSASLSVHAEERLMYLDATGDTETVYSWSIEHGAGTSNITVHKGDVIFNNLCRANGETVAWSQSGRDAEVTATVDCGMLRLTGVFKGERLDTATDLEGLPWLQPLSFSLPRIIQNKDTDVKFWTIRPDTLEPVKLKAEHKGRQTLDIEGEKVEAFRIRISPPGMLSAFWHGDYWYRQDDARFLRYEGLSGPPGSPKTRVTLVDGPGTGKPSSS